MYGIFTYIWVICMANVGKYTIYIYIHIRICIGQTILTQTWHVIERLIILQAGTPQ